MAENRRLSEAEREEAKNILLEVRERITQTARGEQSHIWALRRYIYIRLMHDERGKPGERKKLKFKKMVEQDAKCAERGGKLPEKGSELDRFDAMTGYTPQNTRLLSHNCHRKMQSEKGFS